MSTLSRRIIFRQVAPDRLLIFEGGGIISVAGVGAFCFGCALLASIFVFHTVVPASQGGNPALVCLLGIASLLAGTFWLLGCRWITCDTNQRRIIVEWGLLVPMRRREYHLEDFVATTLVYEASHRGSPPRYGVVLSGAQGIHDISVNDLLSFEEASSQGTQLAEFLGVPLRNTVPEHRIL